MLPRMDTITAADLRAELARRRLPVYILAARVRLHPVRLGRMLSGRVSLTAPIAERIMRAIGDESSVAPERG